MVPLVASTIAFVNALPKKRARHSACRARLDISWEAHPVSVRLRRVPFLEIGFHLVRSLLLFRSALPGLVRLLVRTPVALLPGIVVRPFLAHRASFRWKRLREGDTVVGVDAANRGVVTPVPITPFAVFRRAFQFLGGDARDVPAELRVVFQRLPRQRIVVVTEAQKSAEAEHGVGHLAADLVDHHAFDRANFVAIGAIDRCSLDLVAADQPTHLVLVQFTLIQHLNSPLSLCGDNPKRCAIVPACSVRLEEHRRKRTVLSASNPGNQIPENEGRSPCPRPSPTSSFNVCINGASATSLAIPAMASTAYSAPFSALRARSALSRRGMKRWPLSWRAPMRSSLARSGSVSRLRVPAPRI